MTSAVIITGSPGSGKTTPLAKHAVDVGGMGESEALEKVRSALASGLLELDWSLVVAP